MIPRVSNGLAVWLPNRTHARQKQALTRRISGIATSGAISKEATEAALLALEIHGRNRKEKQAKTGRKEEKKADKAKKRRARTPSPDVRRKHHRRDPPSSEDEEGRPRPHVQMVADGTFLVKLH